MIEVAHRITVNEWLAGFSLILDGAILVILCGYMIVKREAIWSPHYCIAVGITIYMSGHTLRMFIVWHNLFTHPELQTQEQLLAKFPLVGSHWWLIGSSIAAVGLVKLIKTFGEAYLSGHIWIYILIFALLAPLVSFFS